MQNNLTRFAALLVLTFLGCISMAGQVAPSANSYQITVDLQNVSSTRDRIKITIIPPTITGRVIQYVLPAFLPGVNGQVDAGRFVHQFYALDDKGFPLKVSKKGNNIIVMKMRKGGTLKKIEYWVDDTWDDEKIKPKISDEKFNYVSQAAGTNIDAGNNYVLNHAFLFGYIKGYENVPYTISIIKPAELVASSALAITSENQTHDSYQASSYSVLIDNPVMYCRPDTCGFLAGNIYISISVYSENGRVSARLVRRLIASQVSASALFIREIGARNYKMIFYFTTPFKTILNSNGNYGGLAHANSSFYFLPEYADEDVLTNEIQRETSGDILHLLRPLDFRIANSNSDLQSPQFSKAWWFCEGVNKYFSWLAVLRDSFSSENDFMGTISAKIRLAEIESMKSLTDVKSVQELFKIPLKRESIKARAMLVAFLLDIQLTEMTSGRIGLKEAVLQLDEAGKFYPDSLEFQLEKISGISLKDFFYDYVDGTKPLKFIESFSKIGWAYAPEAVDSMLTFGRFGLSYDDNLDVFFVRNADSLNLFGLKNGDRILSVNEVLVGSTNFDEALAPIYQPKNEEEVQIRFIRNDLNYTIQAQPANRTIIIDHLIRRDPAASEKAIALHTRIFTDKLE